LKERNTKEEKKIWGSRTCQKGKNSANGQDPGGGMEGKASGMNMSNPERRDRNSRENFSARRISSGVNRGGN